jgi:hypothetical protein
MISTRELHIGEVTVIETGAKGFVVDFGQGVHITVHTFVDCHLNKGDKVPLYMKVPYADPRPTNS